jgi:hypothetical protein
MSVWPCRCGIKRSDAGSLNRNPIFFRQATYMPLGDIRFLGFPDSQTWGLPNEIECYDPNFLLRTEGLQAWLAI